MFSELDEEVLQKESWHWIAGCSQRLFRRSNHCQWSLKDELTLAMEALLSIGMAALF